MKKLLRISLILAIISAFFMNFSVFAVENEEETTTETNQVVTSASDESSSDDSTDDVDTNKEKSTTTSSVSSSRKSSSDSSTKVSVDTEGSEKKGLNKSDIINIFLIATGVAIILLAIAIFIKLK